MTTSNKRIQAGLLHSSWPIRVRGLAKIAKGIVNGFSHSLDRYRADANVVACPEAVLISFSCRENGDDRRVGAELVIRCDDDGIVRGYRLPFREPTAKVSYEIGYDSIGTTDAVLEQNLAQAVTAFLMWATHGDGAGSHPILRTAA